MRFMMLMIPKIYQPGEPPSSPPDPSVFEAMGRFNEQMVKAGIMLSGDGLHPADKGTRVSYAGGKATAKDGPFAEAKELVGGFWMIDVKSKEEAVQWALRIPALDGDIVEVRQVQEFDDFPPEVQAVIPQERPS